MGNAVITQTCPIGDCPITVTWEFARSTAKQKGFMEASKKRLTASLEGNHKEGNHDKILKEHRNGR